MFKILKLTAWSFGITMVYMAANAQPSMSDLCQDSDMDSDTAYNLEQVLSSTVAIAEEHSSRNKTYYIHGGTGNIVGRSGKTYYVLTTKHQVKSQSHRTLLRRHAYREATGEFYELELLKTSRNDDLALWRFQSPQTLPHRNWIQKPPKRKEYSFPIRKAYILGYPLVRTGPLYSFDAYRKSIEKSIKVRCTTANLSGLLYDYDRDENIYRVVLTLDEEVRNGRSGGFVVDEKGYGKEKGIMGINLGTSLLNAHGQKGYFLPIWAAFDWVREVAPSILPPQERE
uniref:Trypsin-like peptidase domain-containing protein n=1 Tax=Candidatus Kentrum sp. DK TaxID=2126562 RepID=A0A450TJG0_9GAMM|nr:MAG: Trypsin-like peptidase domain-containing protein [Candidatus Kentron sp. DK]